MERYICPRCKSAIGPRGTVMLGDGVYFTDTYIANIDPVPEQGSVFCNEFCAAAFDQSKGKSDA